jgi:predicted Zn-dependent peptidase
MTFEPALTRLPSGVRIASVQMPHMESVCVGFWAAVGGRHETRSLNGVAHFLEHLLFKGTRTRTALQLSEAVESVGGSINAFTSEDHTCYYAKAPARHLPRLCEVLSDMYLASRLDPAEIQREREVILEEISMYRDDTSQHVQDLLAQTLWPQHPLGRPLTGTPQSLAPLRRPQLQNFLSRHYCGTNTIVAAAGRMDHSELVALLSPALSRLPTGTRLRPRPAPPMGSQPRVTVVSEETEQAQIALGFPTFGRQDPRRFALKLLSIVLGENMSSRLFQQLREKHGLCYNISSSVMTLSDSGALDISAGVDPERLPQALSMILSELNKIARRAPSRLELRKACDYAIGQNLLGLESTTSRMMWAGESLLGYGRVLNPSETERRLIEVTPEAIRAVAAEYLTPARLSAAIIGPGISEAHVLRWLQNPA